MYGFISVVTLLHPYCKEAHFGTMYYLDIQNGRNRCSTFPTTSVKFVLVYIAA
jgi:hypothetical protein